MPILIDLRAYKVAYDSLVLLRMETQGSVKPLIHSLYQSNIDTNIYHGRKIHNELDQQGFIHEINKLRHIKRADEIRLYNLLCKINRNIKMECITEKQRDHVKRLRTILRNMETKYFSRFGQEIYDAS